MSTFTDEDMIARREVVDSLKRRFKIDVEGRLGHWIDGTAYKDIYCHIENDALNKGMYCMEKYENGKYMINIGYVFSNIQ